VAGIIASLANDLPPLDCELRAAMGVPSAAASEVASPCSPCSDASGRRADDPARESITAALLRNGRCSSGLPAAAPEGAVPSTVEMETVVLAGLP
jgi:hypothetical protein